MIPPAHVQTIVAALADVKNRYTSETQLAAAIFARLNAPAFPWNVTRELRLSRRDRIDIHVYGPPDVGIEIKVAGGEMEHLRQLYRYAPHYEDLILITTQASAPEPQELEHRGGSCRLHIINISKRL